MTGTILAFRERRFRKFPFRNTTNVAVAKKTIMNKDNAKDYLPLVQALADGKEIQVKSMAKEWITCTQDFYFNATPDNYRIKPEPKWRPWIAVEVPVGMQVRRKGGSKFRMLITSVYENGLYCGPYGCSFGIALADYEHSIDHGTTWKPCGVEEGS
jgi:hypothetical protein